MTHVYKFMLDIEFMLMYEYHTYTQAETHLVTRIDAVKLRLLLLSYVTTFLH